MAVDTDSKEELVDSGFQHNVVIKDVEQDPSIKTKCILEHYRLKIIFGKSQNYALIGRGSMVFAFIIHHFTNLNVQNTCVLTVGDFCEMANSKIFVGGNHDNDKPINIVFGSIAAMRMLVHESDPASTQAIFASPTHIGSNVILSDNVTVLPGSKIGNGVIIGANATVAGHIPDWSIAAGVPARVIRQRMTEKARQKLDSIRWWDLKLSALLRFRKSIDDLSVDEKDIKTDDYYTTDMRLVFNINPDSKDVSSLELVGVEGRAGFTPINECPEYIRKYFLQIADPSPQCEVFEDVFAL